MCDYEEHSERQTTCSRQREPVGTTIIIAMTVATTIAKAMTKAMWGTTNFTPKPRELDDPSHMAACGPLFEPSWKQLGPTFARLAANLVVLAAKQGKLRATLRPTQAQKT